MAAPPPPWAELPSDIVAEIARRLACLADRVHMSTMCRGWRAGWRAASRLPPRTPQLPWLLLPYRRTRILPPHIARRASFFCVLCSDTHRVRVMPDTGGARYFGSYDGGWLFLAHGQANGHALINLHSDRRILLPDVRVWDWQAVPSPKPMVILAATLSSPPVPFDRCVGAAIIVTTDLPPIMFWRMGHQMEVELSPTALAIAFTSLEPEDVIYYNGAFHFLTQGENVLVFTPEFGEELVSLEIRGARLCFLAPEHQYDQYVDARYLVESRGELLMVVRCTPHPGLPTSLFRVFQMTRLEMPDGEVRYSWTELHGLDGRMLFVRRGCSRSFEVADFPEFKDGVYFSDEGTCYNVWMMFDDHSDRQYTCSDNGNWSEPPPHAHRWFPEQPPSNYSSPVWFLH